MTTANAILEPAEDQIELDYDIDIHHEASTTDLTQNEVTEDEPEKESTEKIEAKPKESESECTETPATASASTESTTVTPAGEQKPAKAKKERKLRTKDPNVRQTTALTIPIAIVDSEGFDQIDCEGRLLYDLSLCMHILMRIYFSMRALVLTDLLLAYLPS